MPAIAREAAMEPHELSELLDGFGPDAKKRLAKDLWMNDVSTVNRWIAGTTPISRVAEMAIHAWEYRQLLADEMPDSSRAQISN